MPEQNEFTFGGDHEALLFEPVTVVYLLLSLHQLAQVDQSLDQALPEIFLILLQFPVGPLDRDRTS